ncbi:hypothetical protein J5J83_06395 [Azoarcus sp. L1K30]|uniref:hypothetical protein n=1 Tax=Azoarcus sp. L1K30 TaxID=2820277 RepID=UPI001B81393E|nr:hypothetical protein [Azoarcus sp. L1K30]MBR0565741.1 hypothetical protein [Azoarcus sp. L1K30]
MYPIHNIDAQLLLAVLLSAKRRPATLPDIVAAADLLGFQVAVPNQWGEAFRRLATHGLLLAADGGYLASDSAQGMARELPRKAEPDEQVFLLREKLSVYMPAEKSPSIPIGGAEFDEALRVQAALSKQGGKNLLMPKPKVDEDALRGRRPARSGGSARGRRR